jgi:general nucleoside transport system permease protein
VGEFLDALGDILSSETMYDNAVIVAMLLVFAASGEFVAERAGTINISLEAMMLGGAFSCAVFYDLTASPWVSLLAAAAVGALVAWVQANMSHRLPADQFVVGLVLNVLVLGLVGFLTGEIDPQSERLGRVEVPVLSDIPLVGPALFGQRWPFYLVYAVVPLVWWLVYRTRWGLEVRAVGEDPNAADVSGLHVNKLRRQTIYLTGLIGGLGGGCFLFVRTSLFEDSLIGGRGYLAIAAVIFGGWTLKGTVGGCVLFGVVGSLGYTIPVLGYDVIHSSVLDMAPNVVTIAGMAVFAKRVRQPSSLARPFRRGLK